MRTRVLAQWSLAVGCLLAAASAQAAPKAASSAAQLDSFPNAPDVLLWPPQPCMQSDIIFYVRAFEATPCDSFLSAYRSGDREITIRTITHTDQRCDVAPSVFYAVRIPFGQLPAGPQTVQVRRRMLMTQGGTVVDSLVSGSQLQFTVADSCPAPPPPLPAAELPYVEQVATLPSPACPERPVQVHFEGHLPGCGQLVSAGLDGSIRLVLAPFPPHPTACPQVLVPWSATVAIGQMSPGTYSALVQETVRGTDGIWPPIPDAEYKGLFDFTVAQQCDSTPSGLPYVNYVYVTPKNRLSDRICPGDSIRVNLSADLPNSCWSLRGIQLLPGSPTPVTRFLFDDGACRKVLCYPAPSHLDTSVVLPGAPAGKWNQIVQVGLVSCSDSIPPDSLFTTRVPFTVQPAESCGIASPLDCLIPSWTPGSDRCNAFLSLDGTASLGFAVASGLALSGLQGEFRLVQPGLRITGVEADGPAAQMHLAWTATPSGARFVMFAEHGAPIPGGSQTVPVLRVHLESIAIPDRMPLPVNGFDVVAENILGADENGREVPECPTMRFAAVVAHICIEHACDFDGNGVADVRDLVRMVHCVNGEGPCPPDSVTTFDCNGDSLFDLADVICCAIHLLRGPDCQGCPVDSTRDEPSVRAVFGDPIVTASGVDIPLRLSGTDRLGAARLALRFPSSRFTFAGAETHASAWLELHQGGDGTAAVGLIRVAPSGAAQSAADAQTVDVLVHLALRPGMSRGGQISLSTAEFSGPDGKMLRVDLGATPRSLDGTATLTISSIRPNPSPGTFLIDLALDAPARVEVSVLDLAGRKVAQLFQGDLAAGSRRFVWNGGAGHGGVYFLRASVGGQVVTRKLILLGQTGGYLFPNH